MDVHLTVDETIAIAHDRDPSLEEKWSNHLTACGNCMGAEMTARDYLHLRPGMDDQEFKARLLRSGITFKTK